MSPWKTTAFWEVYKYKESGLYKPRWPVNDQPNSNQENNGVQQLDTSHQTRKSQFDLRVLFMDKFSPFYGIPSKAIPDLVHSPFRILPGGFHLVLKRPKKAQLGLFVLIDEIGYAYADQTILVRASDIVKEPDPRLINDPCGACGFPQCDAPGNPLKIRAPEFEGDSIAF